MSVNVIGFLGNIEGATFFFENDSQFLNLPGDITLGL
jgi:hypothetical protein